MRPSPSRPIFATPRGRALFALPMLALLAGAAQATPSAGHRQPNFRVASPLHRFEAQRTRIEEDLGETASGLESLLVSDDVQAAEKLYDLERRAIALLVYGAEHDVASTGMTHDETIGGMRSMVQRILRYQERVKDYAQDKLDQVLPGEPGRKLVTVDGQDQYRPLFRTGTPLPGQAPATDEQRLQEMEQDFVQKGGDLKSDIALLGAQFLSTLRSGELAEWTQVSPTQISITTRGAKHPVILSQGKKLVGAPTDASDLSAGGGGSAKIWRKTSGEIVLAIASNSSGNLKPGVASVEPLVSTLIDEGVPEERILTTSIVPEEPELVKLLLKARLTLTKEQIADHVDLLRKRTTPVLKGAWVKRLVPSPRTLARELARRAARGPSDGGRRH